jgi:hypothetical protein
LGGRFDAGIGSSVRKSQSNQISRRQLLPAGYRPRFRQTLNKGVAAAHDTPWVEAFQTRLVEPETVALFVGDPGNRSIQAIPESGRPKPILPER